MNKDRAKLILDTMQNAIQTDGFVSELVTPIDDIYVKITVIDVVKGKKNDPYTKLFKLR